MVIVQVCKIKLTIKTINSERLFQEQLLNVSFRLTTTNELEAMAEYPGLSIQYSTDMGQTWTDYTDGQIMDNGTIITLVTR